MAPFGGKCQKSANFIFYVFIFAKIRPVCVTVVTHSHIDTETDNAVTIGEIADLSKNGIAATVIMLTT